MRVRSVALGTIAALALSLGAVGPAQAAVPAAPVISNLDSSTPGHLTGTITSEAPYVRIGGLGYGPVNLAVSGGEAPFDVLTWGLGAATLVVWACPTETAGQPLCSTATSAPFVATDIAPTVTWPSDSTVGPGQDYEVTVSDQGGGYLFAKWGTYGFENHALPHNGSEILPLGYTNGPTTVKVYRCPANYFGEHCRAFPEASTNVRVLRTIVATADTGTIDSATGQPIVDPITSRRSHSTIPSVHTTRKVAVPYDLTWHLVQSGATVPGYDGSASGTLTTTGDTAGFSFGDAELPEGTYRVVTEVVVNDPDFGELRASVTAKLLVDRTAPAASDTTATSETIYPNLGGRATRSGWQDIRTSTSVTLKDASSKTSERGYLEVLDASGSMVFRGALYEGRKRGTSTGYWAGKRNDRTIVPAGNYRLRLTDSVRNTGPSVAVITVSHKSIHRDTFTRTVRASSSLRDTYVGRCSTLRKPSLRRWSGSLGYYANTKCGTQTGKASSISTVHTVRLPPALKYSSVQISLYGGGARSKPNSLLVLNYLRRSGDWYENVAFKGHLGLHRGRRLYTKDASNSPYVMDDRSLVWGVATGYKNRYDIKNFTVTVAYMALR